MCLIDMYVNSSKSRIRCSTGGLIELWRQGKEHAEVNQLAVKYNLQVRAALDYSGANHPVACFL